MIQLSKSDYMLFLRHPAWLWLKKYDRNKLPLSDENLQAMFDEGHLFESYAEQLFDNAVKLGFDNYHEYLQLPSRTLNAIKKNDLTVLQGRFEADGLTCIVDALRPNPDGSFDLIEIKSGTKVKSEHEYDLAFQLLVLEKAGYEIRNIFVMHVNREFVKEGEIDVKKLVKSEEVTDQVRSLMSTTMLQVDMAKEVLSSKVMPDTSPRFVNQLQISGVESSWLQDWLVIYKSLFPDLDKYSVYSLSYPSAKQIGELEDLEVSLIAQVPQELALRPKQVAQIQVTKNDNRIIEVDNIREFLSSFSYPLYFFDYETFSSAIPWFDGCKPYADYPFQYSLHVLKSPKAKLQHLEYLHDSNSNPMPSLLEQLQKDIGKEGTVLTWNMSYEKGCNDRMASLYPQYAEFLSGLNERIEDLMIPFSKMWFFDKDFFGSASIKKVLPVLASELNHHDLDVSDGLMARRLWTKTVINDLSEDIKTEILGKLSEYCTLDTFAMVRILEELKKV